MQISHSPTAETTNACRGLYTTMNSFFNLHNKIAELIVLISAASPEFFQVKDILQKKKDCIYYN